MSTGCMNLDILLDQILSDALAGANESVRAIQRRYPSLSEREASEIFSMISSAAERNDDSAELIILCVESQTDQSSCKRNALKCEKQHPYYRIFTL